MLDAFRILLLDKPFIAAGDTSCGPCSLLYHPGTPFTCYESQLDEILPAKSTGRGHNSITAPVIHGCEGSYIVITAYQYYCHQNSHSISVGGVQARERRHYCHNSHYLSIGRVQARERQQGRPIKPQRQYNMLLLPRVSSYELWRLTCTEIGCSEVCMRDYVK